MHAKLRDRCGAVASSRTELARGRDLDGAGHRVLRPVRAEPALGHFSRRGEREFAGTHLIIDLWGARRLDDRDFVEAAMRRAVRAAGATLLHVHLHHFGPGCGVTGVAVLAESHISVHTWPEREFAAFDVFMCGASDPARAVDVLTEAFGPSSIEVNEVLRGVR